MSQPHQHYTVVCSVCNKTITVGRSPEVIKSVCSKCKHSTAAQLVEAKRQLDLDRRRLRR